MIVDVIKASLGWGVVLCVVLFGWAIIKGDVTEHNTFGFLAVMEVLTVLTTAYCLSYLPLGGKKNGDH
jgi:hypothetical protein